MTTVFALDYGSTKDASTLNAAITAIGTTDEVVLVLQKGTWDINANVDFSSTKIIVELEYGALLDIDTTKTVTFGEVPILTDTQHFTGAGDVSFPDKFLVDPVIFGADYDGTDDQPAFQKAADTGNNLYIRPNSTFGLADEVTLQANQTVYGNWATVKNLISEGSETGKSLLTVSGSRSQITTLASAADQYDITVSLTSAAGFTVGDYIGFDVSSPVRNIAIITNITSNNVTMDRPITNAVPNGANVYKLNTVENIHIYDLNIDFNNNYGYGVQIYYGRNCTINNITGKDLGSKVILLTYCFDCEINNPRCTTAFNVEGGMGYLVRLSLCNDCVVNNPYASGLRHTVDCTAASRNVVNNGLSFNSASTDYGTHSNACKDNMFNNCHAVHGGDGAYGFDESNGDTGNIVDGGYIEDSRLVYHTQLGTNIFKNITMNVNNQTGLSGNGGVFTLQNCTLNLNYFLAPAFSNATAITFLNCDIRCNTSNALLTNTTQTVKTVYNFIGGKIVSNTTSLYMMYNAGTDVTVKLNGTEIRNKQAQDYLFRIKNVDAQSCRHVSEAACTYPLYSTVSGGYVRSQNNTFEGVTNPYYGVSGTNIYIGQDQYISTTVTHFGNSTVSTIGDIQLPGLTAAPTFGNWATHSKVIVDNTAIPMYICISGGGPGTWKPVYQLTGNLATVSDPTGGSTQDAEARTAINTLIDRLQSAGIIQ